MKRILLLLIISVLINAQSGTFDFTDATYYTEPTRVEQIKDGVLLTVLTAANNTELLNASGYGGTSGNFAWAYDYSTNMVLNFNSTVNITTLRYADGAEDTYDVTFTPNTGTPHSEFINGSDGATVTLNFIGITQIIITRTDANPAVFIVDNIIMDASLPVELTSLTASVTGDNVALNWQTATEVNNYGFEIERKLFDAGAPSGNWEKLGFVEGAGNSNTAKSYSFTDNVAVGKYTYRLKQIDLDGSFTYSKEVEAELNDIPTEFVLEQNYPNPFNPTTTIKYSVPENISRITHNVSLVVFNLLGQEVATLVNEQQAAGNYEVKFDGSQFASGIYLYKLQAGEFTSIKRLVLMK